MTKNQIATIEIQEARITLLEAQKARLERGYRQLARINEKLRARVAELEKRGKHGLSGVNV